MKGKKGALIPQVSYEKALAMGPRKFTEKYLFPTMLREHGRGFAMSDWRTTHVDWYPYDDIKRPAPSCNSVMCIGGTLSAIVGLSDEEKLGPLLGLDWPQAKGLFYHWLNRDFGEPHWSKHNRKRFAVAKTPLQKAKVAIDEVKLAIRTRGKSLEDGQ